MKILALSDLHGYLPQIEPCDLLILAGDYEYNRDAAEQGRFMMGKFFLWLQRLPAKHIVWIGGNHDQTLFFKKAYGDWMRHGRAHYLEDRAITIEGVKIYGTPWTPPFFDWWFMASEDQLRTRYAEIPDDTDILVTHGPPYGVCDTTGYLIGGGDPNCGSKALLERIKIIQPKAVVCGHIHEGRGTARVGKTVVYNVTLCDGQYIPKHSPMVIDLNGEVPTSRIITP